ncbi:MULTISPECIES: terpene synthase family protein [Streptomyces]|uniref:terpene synthase family protein n=1 Tax=Streptomyces TaxID=1883 RepID=UPI00287F86DD|nr:terpene synthase family protein [Streptomyces sp. CGMCC 4.1456]WNF65554.1 terpene synthase family protein [Streptomyces sp. CGMCC 4.1456]
MDAPQTSSVSSGPGTVLRWARTVGLVGDEVEQRRLAAMRLEALAEGALPRAGAQDVALTAQWAVFICWVDDMIDRRGMGLVAGEVEEFTAPLREVLASGGGLMPAATAAPHAAVLRGLWERTTEGMSARWRERFTADYTDYLDATEEEVALRRNGVRLSLEPYVRLRRRTITLLPLLDVLERTGNAPLVECPQVSALLGELRQALADVAGWANDLASAADDAAAGQDNLVTVLARQDGCSLPAGRARAAGMVAGRRSDFHTAATALRMGHGVPPERQVDVCRYVDLTQTFMAATLRWLARTGRFTPEPGPPAPPQVSGPQL